MMFQYRNLAILAFALVVLAGFIMAKPDFSLAGNSTKALSEAIA